MLTKSKFDEKKSNFLGLEDIEFREISVKGVHGSNKQNQTKDWVQ